MPLEYHRPDGALMRETAPNEFVAVTKPREQGPAPDYRGRQVYPRPKRSIAFRYGPPQVGLLRPGSVPVVRQGDGPPETMPLGNAKGKSGVTTTQRQHATPQWYEVAAFVRRCQVQAIYLYVGEPTALDLPAPLTPEELWSDEFCIRTVVKDQDGKPVKATADDLLVAPAWDGKPVAVDQDKDHADKNDEPSKIERPWHRWCMLKTTGTPAERAARLVATGRYLELQVMVGADLLMGRDADLTNIGACYSGLSPSEDEAPFGEPELYLAIRRSLDGSTGELADHGLRTSRGKHPVAAATYTPEAILDARAEMARVEKALGHRHQRTLGLALEGLKFEDIGRALFRRAQGKKTAERNGVAAFREAADALAEALKIELKIPYVVEPTYETAISPPQICPLLRFSGLLIGGKLSLLSDFSDLTPAGAPIKPLAGAFLRFHETDAEATAANDNSVSADQKSAA